MKAWELYSWRDADTWQFSLMAGTNRIKSAEEIRIAGVSGIEALVKQLERLAPGEAVYWQIGGLRSVSTPWGEPPPPELADAVQGACDRQGLKLHVITD
ncbi:MAG: hypothetical protein HYZ91_05860 [Candidatus Omnitrophica bacterium]|nr:hypothetical protein [Candidatus Omnitrophota bacterium]